MMPEIIKHLPKVIQKNTYSRQNITKNVRGAVSSPKILSGHNKPQQEESI